MTQITTKKYLRVFTSVPAIASFVYCWILSLSCLSLVCASWVVDLTQLNPNYDPHHYPTWTDTSGTNYLYLTGTNYLNFLYSHFSYQIVFLGGITLLATNFINPQSRWWDNLMIAVTSYLSVSAIIFNAVLLPLRLYDIHNHTSPPFTHLGWATTAYMHIVFPIGFLLYALFLRRPQVRTDLKRFFHKRFAWLLIYPVVYLGIIFVRGELIYRYLLKTDHQFHWINLKAQNQNAIFNYFFFNWHQKTHSLHGYVWTILVATITILILLVATWIYLGVRNLLFSFYRENSKIKQELT